MTSCSELKTSLHSKVKLTVFVVFLQFAGFDQDCRDGNCSVWTYTMTEQHKVNTYTMYVSVTESPDPVHYEMFGYDTLLGSHYDKYEVDYADYSPQMPPPETFDIKGLYSLKWV